MDTHATARQALLSRRQDLTTREARIAARLRNRAAPLSADSSEQAAELQDEEVLHDLDASERAEIERIDAALRRLDDGTWGTCVECGEPIEARRLVALPVAERCLGCAS